MYFKVDGDLKHRFQHLYSGQALKPLHIQKQLHETFFEILLKFLMEV